MLLSGLMVLCFVIFHLLHFTVQVPAVNMTGHDFETLHDSQGRHDVYRMMILPTWGNSILVRVEKHGTRYSLSARRLGGQAGFELGKLVEAKNIELSAEDSKTLEQLIHRVSRIVL